MMAPDSHSTTFVLGSSMALLVSWRISRTEFVGLTRDGSIRVEVYERWLLDVIETEGHNLIGNLKLVENKDNLPWVGNSGCKPHADWLRHYEDIRDKTRRNIVDEVVTEILDRLGRR